MHANRSLGLKAEELRHDPTLFSKISQRYQDVVRFLFNCSVDDLPENSEPRDLEKFREAYLESAFICRYRECPRYSDGFKSSRERDEHERLHAKPLRCADPSCVYFARGFTSKTGLLKHNRKCHPSPDEVELPEFEPRKEPESEPQYSLPPAPKPAPVPPSAPRVEPPLQALPELKRQVKPRHVLPKEKISRAKRGLKVHRCDDCGKVKNPRPRCQVKSQLTIYLGFHSRRDSQVRHHCD